MAGTIVSDTTSRYITRDARINIGKASGDCSFVPSEWMQSGRGWARACGIARVLTTRFWPNCALLLDFQQTIMGPCLLVFGQCTIEPLLC